MRTSNGQKAHLKGKHLNPVEQEFIGNIKFQGIEELVSSLKMIHDFALYHTDLCFDTAEKTALFNLKFLWEELLTLQK